MVMARRVMDMKFNRDRREKSFNILLREPSAGLKCESVVAGMQRACAQKVFHATITVG